MKSIVKAFALLACLIGVLGFIALQSQDFDGSGLDHGEPNAAVDFVRRTDTGVERSDNTTDEEIAWMQASLNFMIDHMGLEAEHLEVDGSYGPASAAATAAFREAVGLPAEGGFDGAAIEKMQQLLKGYELGTTLTLVMKKDGKASSTTELNLRGGEKKTLTITYTPGE